MPKVRSASGIVILTGSNLWVFEEQNKWLVGLENKGGKVEQYKKGGEVGKDQLMYIYTPE